MAIRLIVGLGNPGPRYADTRHNAGAWFVERLARRFGVGMAGESRFKGDVGRAHILGHDVRLLLPHTFMNLSGESVGALARFYRIEPGEILVAYDEMDFEPGVLRLKSGGGANGHNGISSVIDALGNERGFQRLRIGVGHPGDKSRVTAYLTSVTAPSAERDRIEAAFEIPDGVLKDLLDGNLQKVMNWLHAPPAGDAAEPGETGDD
ncbi:MAG TPA: aminoacyl-tRNA hydrolase [Pseudomonadales bacterium]